MKTPDQAPRDPREQPPDAYGTPLTPEAALVQPGSDGIGSNPLMGRPDFGQYAALVMGQPDYGRTSAPLMGSPDHGRYSALVMGSPDHSRTSAPVMGSPDHGRYSALVMGEPDHGRYSLARPRRGRRSEPQPHTERRACLDWLRRRWRGRGERRP